MREKRGLLFACLGSNNPEITAAGTKALRELSELCWEHGREFPLLGDAAHPCSHQEKDPAVGGRSCHPDPLTAG